MSHQTVIVLDFGGQYNQLIARRVRECGVYCEVKPYTTPLEQIRAMNPSASSSPAVPTACMIPSPPQVDPAIFTWGVPILGICYGCQLMAHNLGGRVTEAQDDSAREYGKTETYFDTSCKLFKGLPAQGITWMSHGDYMEKVPEGFSLVAPLRRLPQRSHLRRGPWVLRRPVPPGGEPHPARHRHDPQLPLRGLRRRRRLVHGRLQGDLHPLHPGEGGLRPRSAGPLRRRGLLCRRRPAGRGHRLPAHLRVRGPRPHAPERGRRGGGRLLQVGTSISSGWTRSPASC